MLTPQVGIRQRAEELDRDQAAQPAAGSPEEQAALTAQLKEAEVYHRHACAVYGWPMYLWFNRWKGGRGA